MSKKEKMKSEIGFFIQQYQRKAQRHVDPNDRSYDREFENQLKHLSAEELSKILYGDDNSEE